MNKNKIKKLWTKKSKAAKILIVLAGFLIGLFLYYASLLAWDFVYTFSGAARANELSVNYLISGRGCNDYANASDEKLREFIERELECCISKRNFKRRVLKKQKEYSTGKYQYSNCVPVRERVLEILNSI